MYQYEADYTHRPDADIAIVKLGSDLTVTPGVLHHCIQQIQSLRPRVQTILLPSGAVAFGAAENPEFAPHRKHRLARRVLASRGRFSYKWAIGEACMEHGVNSAVHFVTAELLGRYLYRDALLEAIYKQLRDGCVVSINEDDPKTSVYNEINCNDTLFAIMVGIIRANWGIILTGVDGLYNGPPGDPDSMLIEEVNNKDNWEQSIQEGTSEFGTGGMRNKIRAALLAAEFGANTIIANGLDLTHTPVTDFINGEPTRGTRVKHVSTDTA